MNLLDMPELFLNGSPCLHFTLNPSGIRYHTFNINDVCTTCGLKSKWSDFDSESEIQKRYELFIWRAMLKKIQLEWIELEGIKTAHLFDYKKNSVFTRAIVVESTAFKWRFSAAAASTYGTDKALENRKTLAIFGARGNRQRPAMEDLSYLVDEAYKKYPDFKDYVKSKGQVDFRKSEIKNKTLREKSNTMSAITKADKFNYTEQLSMATHVVVSEIDKALLAIGGKVRSSYSHEDSPIVLDWKGKKAYLLRVRNDETLDVSGKKLYEAIVDLLGSAKANEYIQNSTNVIFKRLSVCILGNLVLGLCESDRRTRMAAEKLLKAQT